MKLRIKQKDIITKGYMHLGPHTDKELVKGMRGLVVYPDPGEGRIPVMIVRREEAKESH